ncbi:MAG: Verru_Chthon cassette protein C [Verrucomicrobiaceae bacterium]|nr:Verru_Chthon cassette protein C [Verrucomicrobiaceae bacterium]
MNSHSKKTFCSRRYCAKRQAFTLVELMVSVSILVILMLVVSSFVNLVQRTWVRTNSNISQFREARLAFDAMTRTISQATLNTYWQAGTVELSKNALGTRFQGTSYRRQSELQFCCGPTVGGATALFSTGTAANYPGHGVFFQAPLGVTGLISPPAGESTAVADTQNMVNLLCGRGYFVAWGDDSSFRPQFLNTRNVPKRTRFRLMEFSPTAEKNPIYSDAYRLSYSDDGLSVENSKDWFRNATDSTGGTSAAIEQTTDTESEDASNREFTRPIAENILALVISPRLARVGRNEAETYKIAPSYNLDSTSTGAVGGGDDEFGPQGTQHLLPPLLQVTMVALDSRGGERLSFDTQLQSEVAQMVTSRFNSAASYATDLKALEDDLIEKRLAYRVFTSAIPLRQSRWSK